MNRKARRNITAFSRIQQSPSRIKYLAPQLVNKAELYAKVYQEVKK